MRPLRTMLAATLWTTAAGLAQADEPHRAVLAMQAWGTDASAYIALDGERLAVRHALSQPLDAVRASLDTGVELRAGAHARLRLGLHTGLTRSAPTQAIAITFTSSF